MSGSQLDDTSVSDVDDDDAPAPLPNIPLPPIPNIPPNAQAPNAPNNPPPNNPPPGNPPPPQPAPPQNPPANVAPQNARPVNDSPEQRNNRRWSVWAKGVFHLPDAKGQNQILASAVATFARIDETTLQPGKAATLANTPATQNDPSFALFVTELGRYESLPLPREEPQARPLLNAARAARQNAANDQAKLGPIDETLAALKAFELRNKITGAGRPPWTGRAASGATAAKVELDMMSLGPNRTMRVQGGGVNPSYWVERSANDGSPDKRSFLCKPAGGQVGGIPVGGEVSREALTGRAATILKNAIRLDLDMPETHVISMPDTAFPVAPQGAVNGQVTCSVQEAKAVTGDFESASNAQRRAIPASQCAATIMMDLVSLNTDRHVGNVMVGTDGGLVPIDHGCAFPDADNAGKSRIRNLMSGPHNAMLQLPGSHAPMTDEMAAGVRGMDPKDIRDQLAAADAEVGQDHPSMAGKVSPASLDMSLASARFLKLAGDIESGKKDKKVRLSPASVQVAFGANATELLAFPPPTDDKTAKPFDKRAKQILKQALADQPLLAHACTLEDTSYAVLVRQLVALGWRVQERADAPTGDGISSDPVLCAKLVALQLQRPAAANNGTKQIAAARELVARAKVKPDRVKAALADVQIRTLQQMVAYLPGPRANALTTLLNTRDATLRSDDETRRKLVQEIEGEAKRALAAAWQALDNNYTFDPGPFRFKLGDIEGGLRRGDLAIVQTAIADLTNDVAQNRAGIAPKNAPQNAPPPQNNAQAQNPPNNPPPPPNNPAPPPNNPAPQNPGGPNG